MECHYCFPFNICNSKATTKIQIVTLETKVQFIGALSAAMLSLASATVRKP